MDKDSNNDKTSFWRKNSSTVPGRPSPKRELKYSFRSKQSGKTSFQDFQASVEDAWKINDDGPSVLGSTKISKELSHFAAINVIKSHNFIPDSKLSEQSVIKITPDNAKIARYNHIPGRAQQMRHRNTSEENKHDSKLDRFEIYLSKNPSLQGLCELSWSGVPEKVRPTVWRLLSGYLPMNLERRENMLERKRLDYWSLVEKYYYADHDENEKDIKHQIDIDIPRMNPTIPLFQQITVQAIFERILFIWSTRHPATSYVQGINDLVTPFFVVFLQEYIPNGQAFETFNVDELTEETLKIIEADSFWCLSKFLDGIQDNYVFAQIGIQRKVLQLEELITRVDENLHCHLKRHNVDYLQFSFRWLNNLLTRELPLRCIITLWDTYLAESDNFASFQLYVCAAFLLHWKKDLMRKSDFQGILILLQNLPTHGWSSSHISLLVAEAYKLKYIFADAPNHLQRNKAVS